MLYTQRNSGYWRGEVRCFFRILLYHKHPLFVCSQPPIVPGRMWYTTCTANVLNSNHGIGRILFWQALSKHIHQKIQIGGNTKMPARFTGNVGSPAMILKQESLCIKFFVSKGHLLRRLKNRTNASVVKLAVGDLRTEGNQQQNRHKRLPPRKHLQYRANTSSAARASVNFPFFDYQISACFL